MTSRSPSELYDVLGPEGVDYLLRQFMTACWNALPAGTRTFGDWRKLTQNVFDRNMRTWSRIKKPNPVEFFRDLRAEPADGHLRQAMVLSWMMLPRAGGRKFSDTKKIIAAIYQRSLAAWEVDNATFTGSTSKKAKKPAAARKKPAAKKGGRTAPSRKAKGTKRRR